MHTLLFRNFTNFLIHRSRFILFISKRTDTISLTVISLVSFTNFSKHILPSLTQVSSVKPCSTGLGTFLNYASQGKSIVWTNELPIMQQQNGQTLFEHHKAHKAI